MPKIHASLSVAQQQIAITVARGFHFWTSGVVIIEKFSRFADSFGERYGTDLSRGVRQYRHSRGLGNAHLICWQTGSEVHWWLLVSDGKHPAQMHERLRDARKSAERITFGSDYVLLESTRLREYGGGTRWTWFLTRDCEAGEARGLAKIAQEGNPASLRGYCQTLIHRPMHSGVRSQTAKMLRRAAKVWHQHHAKPWPGPDPSTLPIMQFLRSAQQTGPVITVDFVQDPPA